MSRYHSLAHRQDPSFVALILSICCLSSRYTQDARIAEASSDLFVLAHESVTRLAAERIDLEIVQALFNMSVVQEGTSSPAALWVYLSQAVS